jgi:hypothetical protein
VRASAPISILVLVAASIAAHAAHAEEPAHAEGSEFPVSYVERPLTLPRFTLAPFGELDIDRFGTTGSATGGLSTSVVLAGMMLGASFGITKDAEIGAILIPVQFNESAGFGGLFYGDERIQAQPSVFATYRFLNREPVELGARLLVQFLVPRTGLGAGVRIEPSVPLLVHIGKIGRFDAEVGVPITVEGSRTEITNGVSTAVASQAYAGIDVPVRIAFDIIEPLHIGLNTGLVIEDFGHAGETTAIPLGLFTGYAVGQKKPIVDIDAFFSWFDFITPGGGPFGDKVNPGLFVVGLKATGYVYF